MSDPKIVASGKKQVHPGSVHRDSSRSWLVLGWIGLVFLVVGGTDFLLLWWPPNFGAPEWEFGTVTQSLNGLPILLLGLGLTIVAAEEVDRGWWGLVGLAVAVGLLLWVLVGAVLWSLNVSLALETAPGAMATTVTKAVAKTAIQFVVYIAALAFLIGRRWLGWSVSAK